MRFRCPHCGAYGNVRTSEPQSATVTYLYVACVDLECGHTWRVDAEAAVTLSPSAKPRADVLIPLSPHVQRGRLTKNLELAREGDHRPFGPWIDDMFDCAPGAQPTG